MSTSKNKTATKGKIKTIVKTPNVLKTCIIRTNGDVEEIMVSNQINVDYLDYDELKGHYKKIGKGAFERQCDWELDDFVFSIFGWKDGKESAVNKFELPPPEDTDLYYGDILVIKSKDDKPVNLTADEFEEFYNHAYGGFEDLGDEDTDEEDSEDDEYDFTDGFLVKDDAPIEFNSSSSSEEDEDDEEDDDDEDDEEDEEDDDDDEEDEDDEDDEEEDDEDDEDDEETSEDKEDDDKKGT